MSTNVTKENGKYIVTGEASEITVKEAQKYNDNRGMQGGGLFISVFFPLVVTGMLNNYGSHNVPDALDNKEARPICLQESYSKTSPNEDKLVNLSAPEIETCVKNKVALSRQQRADDIHNYYELKSQFVMGLSGLFAAAGLGMTTYGAASNMNLRRKKPGIKHAARAERLGVGLG
jgi:hypothetical protein